MPSPYVRRRVARLPRSRGICGATSTFPREGSVAMERSDRVKITLKWIQILDKLEPFYKERGEFRFKARVSTPDGRVLSETTLPKEGHLEISDRPGWNRVTLDVVVFEGQPGAQGLAEVYSGWEPGTRRAHD